MGFGQKFLGKGYKLVTIVNKITQILLPFCNYFKNVFGQPEIFGHGFGQK